MRLCGGGSILTYAEPEPDDAVFDVIELEYRAAADDATPHGGLIYRVFMYTTPGAAPAEPAAVAFGPTSIRSVCGMVHGCAPRSPGPFPTVDFIPGQTACVRVAVEDAAGNVSPNYDEVCGTVEYWHISGYCDRRGAIEFDSGVPPRDAAVAGDIPGANSSDVTPSTSADSATSPGASPTQVAPNDGCSCSVNSDGMTDGLLLLLILALTPWRRRRTRG